MGKNLKGKECDKGICQRKDGLQPKVLQKLLGHVSIKTTMDRYVHVTDNSLSNGMRQFEENQIG
ncbi:MAG: hypothetical protein RR590_05165 [Hungatella sp.]